MRPFGSLIDKTVKFREPTVPGARLDRVNPSVSHRLDEGIADLFNTACILNDLDAAADLVTLLEKWHTRRWYGDEQQRRVGGVHLKRMHGELERRHIMRGSQRASVRMT
jgi:hypothetical protein